MREASFAQKLTISFKISPLLDWPPSCTVRSMLATLCIEPAAVWIGRRQPIHRDSFLDDFVAAHDQPVAGENLVIRRDISLLLNGGEIDLVDPGRLAATARPHQADVIRLSGRQKAPRELEGIQHRFVPCPWHPAGNQDIAKNVIVLRVIGRDVHENEIGFGGRGSTFHSSSTALTGSGRS